MKPPSFSQEWKGFDFEKHVKPYMEMGYVEDKEGYIVWRTGTGGNVELLHLKVREVRKGHGRRLFKEMLRGLVVRPPYETVFGFVLEDNHVARSFYRAMGMTQTPVKGVYRAGMAVVFSETYKNLKGWHDVK